MISGRRRAVAALGAIAIVASGAMWAPATAQTPTQCVPVPGGTPGTTVKVGDVSQPVPAISNVQVCAGGTTLPQYRVATTGGACTSSCYSVYVGGGAFAAGTVTVTWVETVSTPTGTQSTPKSQVISPGPVPLPAETCVLSTGAPSPADPACFAAVGVVPPPDALTPVVEVALDAVDAALVAVGGAVQAACNSVPDDYNEDTSESVDFCTHPTGWGIEVGTDAVQLTCDQVPDRYDPSTGETIDACTNPAGWALSFADEVIGMTCEEIPDRTDPDTGQTFVFCDDPVGWGNAVYKAVWRAGGDAIDFTCATIPDWTNPATAETYDFCTDPVGWSGAVVQYSYNTTCSAFPIVYDDWGREYRFCDDPVGWLNEALEDGEQLCNSAVPHAYDYRTNEWVYPCTEPGRWTSVMIDNWCGSLCDVPPVNRLIHDIIVYISSQEIKIIWGRA